MVNTNTNGLFRNQGSITVENGLIQETIYIYILYNAFYYGFWILQ